MSSSLVNCPATICRATGLSSRVRLAWPDRQSRMCHLRQTDRAAQRTLSWGGVWLATMPSTSSLRSRLLLLSMIAVVPAVALILLTQSSERNRARARTLESNLRLTRLAATQQAAIFDEAHDLLLTLARFQSVHASDPGACNELLPGIFKDHVGYAVLTVEPGSSASSRRGPRPLAIIRLAAPQESPTLSWPSLS
jgi:hypothetical protein